MEKQLRSLSISDEFVKITFVEADYIAASNENEEEDDKVSEHLFSVRSAIRPHKDLTDAMKKLRKLGLEALEINVADAKDVHQWDCVAINIAGSITLQKSRLIMTLEKNVKATGKGAKIKTGQITMYPDAEDKVKFPFADKLTPLIEDVCREAFEYLNGKTDDDGTQYVLFPEGQLVEA